MARKIKWVGIIFSFLFILCLFLAISLSNQWIPENIVSTEESASSHRVTRPVSTSEASHFMAQKESGSINQTRDHIEQTVPSQKIHKESVEEKPYVDQEILVQFAPKMSRNQIVTLLDELGMTIEQVLNKRNLCRVKLPESIKVDEAVKMFEAIPDIQISEPNYIVRTTRIPDDSSFSSQWGYHNTGQNSGTNDADIDAPEAWEMTTGSSSVVVAVVDEGVDLNHPDLADNIWVNTGEIPDNGIDDDGNGYIDDVNGWDFNHNDLTVYDSAGEDRHGTEVAGIIGAVGNNEIGTSGVCWNVRIMPVKFISYGSGSVSDAVLALHYAVDNGAKVINCSWGGSSYSAALKGALQDVQAAGVLVATSAGNSSKDTDTKTHYPSNYDLDNVLSIAATDKNDELSYFSNYGLTTVDLAAPGSSIYTTTPDNGYAYFSGTSASTPFVTGAAALLLAAAPNLSYLELRDILLNHVDPLDSLTGKTVTGGRLNVNNMVVSVGQLDSDGDGMPNNFENQYGLDPEDPDDGGEDPDQDGLTNLQEYQYSTDPSKGDTDEDGLPDNYEIIYQLDPRSNQDGSTDLDEDGLTNRVEYEAGTRVDLGDTDGDGIDDFTEYGSHEEPANSDGDDAIDALDLDSDDDGKSDAEEGVGDDDDDGIANYVDMNDSDGPLADQDKDGLMNSVEATYQLNPNLADSDGDGIGDGVEFGEGDSPLDSDGDEVFDALDSDSDNDGKGDFEESVGDEDGDAIPNYRDNNDQDGPLGDTDGDGLTNQLEAMYGLNPNLADSDRDHISDASEFGADLTPQDTDGDGTIDALDQDSDNDGATDENEAGSDTDGDGIPDQLDRDSATVIADYGKLSLLLAGSSGEFEGVVYMNVAESEVSQDGYDFHYGGVQFQVNGLELGESIVISLRITSDFPSDTEFWKYSDEEGYTVYPSTVVGDTLEYTLTDGGSGDSDGEVNGIIVDPGYIVVPSEVDQQSGSTSAASSGGGGSGCSLQKNGEINGNSILNLLVLILPISVLVFVRLIILFAHSRVRSRV